MPPDSLSNIRLNDKKELRLDEKALGTDCFAALKGLFPPQTAFTLSDCEPPLVDSTATHLTVNGRCDALFPWLGNISGSRNISLTLLDCSTLGITERHAVLVVSLPNRSDLYPLISQYSEEPNEDLDSLLAEIAARADTGEPRVVFSSMDTATITGELAEPLKSLANSFPAKALQKGINFAAEVTLSADWLEYVQELLKQSGFQSSGYGVIYLRGEEKRPYLRFTNKLSGEIEVKPGNTRILAMKATEASFDVPLLPMFDDDEEGAEIILGGKVALGSGGLDFDVSANIGPHYGEVTVAIKNFPSVSELATLAGGQELGAYFPEPLAQLLNIQLSELALALTLSDGNPSVSLIRCAISTGELNVVPGVLSLRPSGTIRINAPFDSENRAIEGELRVAGKIGNTEVEGSIAFPSYAFHAGMKPGQSVSILDIGKSIAPDLDLSKINLAQISLTKLDLSGDLFAGSFRGEIGVDTQKAATFKLGEKSYGITGMSLAMHLDKLDGAEAEDLTTGNAGTDRKWMVGYNLEGQFLLRSTPIVISAQYDDDGWALLGGTEGGQSLEVGNLIAELFPALPIPPTLTNLKLADISFAAYLSAGEFSFSGRLEKWRPVQEIPLEFEVDEFRANYDSSGVSGKLSVVLTIPLGEGALGDIVICLRAEKKPGEKGGWQFNGSTRQEISIGAMIGWVARQFGAVSLPDALTNCTIKNLGIAFDTETKNFTFNCEGTVRLPETKTEINGTVVIKIERRMQDRVVSSADGGLYNKTFGGTLVIRPPEGQPLNFDVVFATEPVKAFLATYHGDQPISIDSLLTQVFTEPITTGVELTLKNAIFAYRGDQKGAKYIFGLKIGIDVGLAKLPLVGPALPPELQVSVDDLQILVATPRAFRLQEVNDLNSLIPTEGAKLPSGKPDGGDTALRKGLNVSAKLKLAGTDKLLMAPASEAAAPPQGTTAPAGPPPTAPAPTEKTTSEAGFVKWFNIQKSLGPLRLQRLGVQFKENRLGFLFDAGMDLAALSLDLVGLSVSLPISKPRFEDLRFSLDGAGVAFERGPLTISGGLLKVPKTYLQLDGALLIRVPGLTIAAIGSYADIGVPSFFAFAVLLRELGDPTATGFFFVTGLAFGFGVNRELKLPTINEVQDFPLIKAATDEKYLGPKLDLRNISQKLGEYIAPSAGNFWIAAGVRFTSYGQIDTFALLSVSFGTRLEIALLGLSKIQLPKPPAPVLASAELAIRVVIAPDSGLLSIEARLTENSYLLRQEFKLRGGFAFYTWFAGEHAGDFVISLGGYHPRFLVPAHYPRPDLVQFQCKIGDVTLQGSCYFALCPSFIMAGVGLSLVYQSGGIRAWFIAYAHFLLGWKPLHYDVEIAILVGVSLSLGGDARTSISVELGAQVNLYGPPLGGVARISFGVVTFTAKFGEGKSVPPPMLWESNDKEKSFAKSFLPNPAVTRILLADGLLEEVQHGRETTRFVNPHKLTISCRTQVPATALLYNGHEPGQIQGMKVNGQTPGAQPWWNSKIGVRPMGKSQCYSLLEVTFAPRVAGDGQGATGHLDQYVEVSLTTGKAPRALWADDKLNSNSPSPNQMVDDTLVGLEMRTKEGPRPWETPALDLKVLSYDRYPKRCDFAAVDAPDGLPDPGQKTVSTTIGTDAVAAKRREILEALRRSGRRIMKPEKVQLQQLKENALYIFQARPVMARPGQYPPRGYLEV